ncbi:SRPBCC family protein [Arthrobacter jiangjiafuii]|uniref:SRPBCC family protein n=1 Tax=Arthrobacter jiangjiafuii TaxID=2817475 RepID=A0A975R1N7_9MICC|nr:SRPBCC family protein [Arthrobacter jiangjiafuii]MBP3043647.1 SRPBCC family protein [Arthrobacter jiangjiafuii]QWC10686.1 SRPBCC family protein [Arthrobacter jiangjiafuii]
MTNALELNVPEGVPFINFSRELDFPVSQVFHAYADPELIVQWLGPRGMQMEVDHYDFHTGGSYRYIHTGPDGVPYAFSGIFHSVKEDESAIQTFEFSGYPDVVSIEFMTVEQLDGDRTRISVHAVYPSMEARDGMAASGMEGGVAEGFERLDELLAQLQEGSLQGEGAP